MWRSTWRILSVVVLSLGLGTALELPKIDHRPAPWDLHRGFLESVPNYDPANPSGWQVDLRGYNLSRLDLREAGASLQHAVFDDKTLWPAPDRLPRDFDRARIVELGKNPGLGVRSLHAKGITGRGVGIAIVDTPLLTEHQEYAARLRLYEEINVHPNTEAHMHGPAVASIAVGKTVGVAPEADLYFIASWPMDLGPNAHEEGPTNFAHEARAVRRILQINDQLPAERKIRVLSMSTGWQPGQTGSAEITQAVDEAKAQGMLVICSIVEQVHGFKFHGLGRDPRADPDDFASYRPARLGAQLYARHDRLLVPMDARTTASPTGKDGYAFYAEGGVSWAIPYIAGMYALAAQVDPKITPERFWALAMKTGRTGSLGPILDPAHLVEALQRGDLSDKAAVAAELAKYADSSGGDRDDRVSEDFAARIARLDIDHAGRKDVIEQLGQPVSYRMGKEVLDPDNLPSRYAMLYPGGFYVSMSADRVRALVFNLPGYLWRNRIEVGTPIQDVFQVLGPPGKTVENARSAEIGRAQLEDGTLYRNIDGVAGTCVYNLILSQGVSLYFTDNRVRQMILVPKER
jgi:hypothetical protein